MTTTTPMTNRTPIEWLWLAALALPALVLGLTLVWPAAAASPDPMVLAQAGAPAQVAEAQPGMRREMHGGSGMGDITACRPWPPLPCGTAPSWD